MTITKLAALAAAIFVAAGLSASAQTIKFGTLAPQGSPWHAIARDMAEAWKTESAGKVDVRIYPSGVAGDDPDMVRKMRIGQLQMAGLTGVGLSRIPRNRGLADAHAADHFGRAELCARAGQP